VHATEDSKSLDNYGVLSMVQSFELHTNRVFYQLIWWKLISQWLKQKVTERGEGRLVCVPGLGEFFATADSEAS